MATKILFAPKQSDAILEIARSLTPAGFELLVAEFGTPEFYAAAGQAEYYLGLARQMGGEFFRSAPNLKLVQLLSAGYDRVDIEAARKSGRAGLQQRGRQRDRGRRAHDHADARGAQAAW